ncbi:MAG: DinB family protein [Sphingobacteriaceae bacterium]
MYRKTEDFLEDWRDSGSSTIKVFSNISDEARSVKVHQNIRTLERLAWHITQSISEIGTAAGLFEKDILDHRPVPSSFEEISVTYHQYSELLFLAVKQQWNDDDLEDLVNMYGQVWKKGKVLSMLFAHETHHRSQMTVIMRMLNLPVPGIFGPSKEEWEAMGMTPME